MDRGAWRAAVHEVAESDMTERLTFSLFSPHFENSHSRASSLSQESPVGIYTEVSVLLSASEWTL